MIMAIRLTKYTTPSADHSSYNTDVCLEQEVVANVPLKLNGQLSNLTGTEVNFLKHGYSRTISIFAIDFISSEITFFVKGMQNNREISEEIVVKKNKDEESVNIYDEVYSIVPTNNSVGDKARVGLGDKGFFRPLFINSNEFTITVVNDQKNKLKKLTLYSASEDIKGTYSDAIANITSQTRSSDLEEIEQKSNVEYYRLSSKDAWLSDFILVYFEKSNPTESNTTLRYLEKKE